MSVLNDSVFARFERAELEDPLLKKEVLSHTVYLSRADAIHKRDAIAMLVPQLQAYKYRHTSSHIERERSYPIEECRKLRSTTIRLGEGALPHLH
jgi:hypothetical protein